jgi:tetratricopeptide (TPR) repeat protein
MNAAAPSPLTDKAAQARSLCERGGWAELLGFTLDWQLETPGDARAFFYRGVALASSGQPTEAEASYRRALQLDPDDFKAWNNLAALLFDPLNRPQEGVQCLAQALKREPRNKLGWANLASMCGQLGRHARALECAERALAIDPECVEAHLHRARAAQALGKMEIVRTVCEALAQLPPEKFTRAR